MKINTSKGHKGDLHTKYYLSHSNAKDKYYIPRIKKLSFFSMQNLFMNKNVIFFTNFFLTSNFVTKAMGDKWDTQNNQFATFSVEKMTGHINHLQNRLPCYTNNETGLSKTEETDCFLWFCSFLIWKYIRDRTEHEQRWIGNVKKPTYNILFPGPYF